jgi:hypothetical protein
MPSSLLRSRAVLNGLMATAVGTAVLSLTFAVLPAGNTRSPADSVATAVPGSAAGDGLAATPEVQRASRAEAARQAAAASAAASSAAASAAARAATTAAAAAAVPEPEPVPVAAAVPVAVGGPPPSTGDRMYIGSVAGGYEQAVAGAGVDLANHAYAFFSGNVPQAEMVTVSAADTKWRDVAAAAPGSALHGQIVRWADTIKARGETVMVAYNHEPEAHDRLTLGSAAEYIAAHRNVVSIFDQRGATNVWTWQMTAYAFRVDPSSDQHAAKWYPGDEWIDNVGADSYNWYSCGHNAPNPYNELQQIGDPVLAFARAHGKKASFPEFASHANGNRAQWLANAHRYLVANRDVLTAAFYFNRPPTIQANADCRWGLTTAGEYGVLRQMAQDTTHFTV